MHPSDQKQAARNEELYLMREAGATWPEIVKHFGLSYTRVHAIYKAERAARVKSCSLCGAMPWEPHRNLLTGEAS